MHISSLEQMSVAGVMHRGVITCPPETPLASVARTLFENRIHAIFVAGEWAREGYEEMVWAWSSTRTSCAPCARQSGRRRCSPGNGHRAPGRPPQRGRGRYG